MEVQGFERERERERRKTYILMGKYYDDKYFKKTIARKVKYIVHVKNMSGSIIVTNSINWV